MRLGFFSVALSFLLDLFLLRWILGNDGNEICRHWSVQLETISKLLQVVQFNLFVVPRFCCSGLFNIFPLLSSETLECRCYVAFHCGGGIRWPVTSYLR